MKTKTFDAVSWMRTRRSQIDEEDRGLSWEKRHAKTRRLLEKDPLWLRLKDRVLEPSSSLSIALSASKEKYVPNRKG
jgi:hypothetical protein